MLVTPINSAKPYRNNHDQHGDGSTDAIDKYIKATLYDRPIIVSDKVFATDNFESMDRVVTTHKPTLWQRFKRLFKRKPKPYVPYVNDGTKDRELSPELIKDAIEAWGKDK